MLNNNKTNMKMKKNYIQPEINIQKIECAICAASNVTETKAGAELDFGDMGSGDAISAHSRKGRFCVWGDDEE